MPKPVRINTIEGVSQRELIDALIATGALKVKRCEPFRRTNLNPKRSSGRMPSYLNPLTMGETLAELEAQARA